MNQDSVFPAARLSGVDAATCIGRQLGLIIDEVISFLRKYYAPTVDYLDIVSRSEFTLCNMYFAELRWKIQILTPVFMDMVGSGLNDMVDLMTLQYGAESDEVYVYRCFQNILKGKSPQALLDGGEMGRFAFIRMDDKLKQILWK